MKRIASLLFAFFVCSLCFCQNFDLKMSSALNYSLGIQAGEVFEIEARVVINGGKLIASSPKTAFPLTILSDVKIETYEVKKDKDGNDETIYYYQGIDKNGIHFYGRITMTDLNDGKKSYSVTLPIFHDGFFGSMILLMGDNLVSK